MLLIFLIITLEMQDKVRPRAPGMGRRPQGWSPGAQTPASAGPNRAAFAVPLNSVRVQVFFYSRAFLG